MGLMKERDEYYSYYEKLMRMAPQATIEETPEYQAMVARYPHLSKSVRLQKELERLRTELKSAKERSIRLHIRSEMKSLVRQLKQLDILKRLHDDGKRETNYRRRFAIATVIQRLSSMVQTVSTELQSKLEEQSRRARLSRVSKLPPSLFDLRSLDSVDRASALREWIEKRGTGIEAKGPPVLSKRKAPAPAKTKV